MGIEIIIHETQDDIFYSKMGYFFANRKFAQEFGGWQFYTKEDAVWFVAYLNGNVVGFNSIIIEKKYIFFDNFYILKDYRGKGLSNKLHHLRMDYAKKIKKEIRLICDNPIQIKRYTKENFNHYGFRGRYHKFKYNGNTN